MSQPLAAAALAALLASTTMSGCSPIKHSHGYTPRAAELESVRIGSDSRLSVQEKLGRPSTIGAFDDDDWYYISQKTETLAFYEPEVVEQQVVLVSFDATGIVSDIGRYGLEDGRVIDLVSRTTPTSGRKLTILQQIFSNIGRFKDGSNLLDRARDTPGGI